MTLQDIFREHRDTLIAEWTEAMLGTYPFETVGFLRSRKDQFSNPVGHITSAAAEAMYDAIAGEDVDLNVITTALEDLVKVRAIQQFSPEQALGVLCIVKPLLRKKLMPQVREHGLFDAWLDAESRIDSLLLMGFGFHAACREKLHMMKVDEYKNRYAQVIRRAERIVDNPAGEPEISKPIA